MKLAKISIKLAVTLAVGSCLLMGVGAETAPATKTVRKPRVQGTTQAPRATPATNLPANNETRAADRPTAVAGKRDPFLPLISEKKETAGGTDHLPSGKAGLAIGALHVNGTVRATDGMIAVLANADDHVYFVREGDRLYDGHVEKIGLDGVTFRQNSKDAFGKPVERVVTKRIYASAGEQQ